jgi:riboflavin synthase
VGNVIPQTYVCGERLMFSGIIEEIGKVVGVRRTPAGLRLEIAADRVLDGTKIGDSISVNGVCLTVVSVKNKVLSFDAISETMRVTTLRMSIVGAWVNLERSLKVGDRVGGHFVTGHVDTKGVIRAKKVFSGNLEFHIAVPASARKYLIHKGSVAVDGISLTIARLGPGGFWVGVIPHTAKDTTLGFKRAGDEVNIECDILAKRSSL